MDQLRERIKFVKTFISDKNVAAFVASSKFVVRNVGRHIQKPIQMAVECGPGEGVMTRRLLEHLSLEGMLLAIESNKEFVSSLKSIDDPRLYIIEGRAQDIITHAKERGMNAIDLVVASIPFSFLKSSERLQLVRDIHNLLAPHGTLIIFHQYSPLMYRTVKKVFGNASISFEARNVPPCFIMIGQK